jgi:hypothetical protein
MGLRRSLLVASGAVLLAVASAQVGHTPAPGESDEASDVSFSSDAGDLILPPCMNGCDATLIDAMRAANNHDAMCAALAPVYDSMCMDDCKGAGPVEHVIDEYLEECCAYPPWGPRGVLGGGRGERVSSPGGGAERSGRVRNVGLGLFGRLRWAEGMRRRGVAWVTLCATGWRKGWRARLLSATFVQAPWLPKVLERHRERASNARIALERRSALCRIDGVGAGGVKRSAKEMVPAGLGIFAGVFTRSLRRNRKKTSRDARVRETVRGGRRSRRSRRFHVASIRDVEHVVSVGGVY